MSSPVAGASSEAAYHWPADLLPLLVETIPRLCRSKRNVVEFFRGAGVPRRIIGPLDNDLRTDPDSLNKFEMTRRVLILLNEGADATLTARREVVKRVVEFEEFATCWPNDQLQAQGLVAQVRALVKRRDSFTRMEDRAMAAEAERLAKAHAENVSAQEKRARLATVQERLGALAGASDPHRRGKEAEGVLDDLFQAAEIGLREAFTVTSPDGEGVLEQLDGAIQLDGHQFLVEVKWWKTPVGPPEVNHLLSKVAARGEVRGLFVSASSYTPAAVQTAKEFLRDRVVVLCGLDEIFHCLVREHELKKLLRDKVTAAQMDKDPYYRPLDDL
jgi:restriction system protein